MATADQTNCDHDWNDEKVWTGGPSYIRICSKCSAKETFTKVKK